ncbi:hypothetical protein AB6D06_22505 [Vibrio sp. 10N.239.311.G01]|uniref:hypothetical protein n=1 Tax=unclassified Vibrio TaxID=2614977 RepID=UPI00354C7E2C
MNKNEANENSIVANICLWLGVALPLLGIAELFGVTDSLPALIKTPFSAPLMVIGGLILLVLSIKHFVNQAKKNKNSIAAK